MTMPDKIYAARTEAKTNDGCWWENYINAKPYRSEKAVNALLDKVEGDLEWIIGYDGNQHMTAKAEQALSDIKAWREG